MSITGWTFGGNSYSQWRSGTIYLTYQPWWLALIGWFEDSILSRICDILMWIQLPNIGKIESDGEYCTWKEYYGSIGDLFHIYIHTPIFEWYYANKNRKEIKIEVGYDELKKLFYKYDQKYFDEHEEIKDE